MRVMHESEARDRERDRDALRRYEKRMGFRQGRDRISIAAFPVSMKQQVADIFEVDENMRMGEGKRWANAPRSDEIADMEPILRDFDPYSVW
jgi:hypothetical protein